MSFTESRKNGPSNEMRPQKPLTMWTLLQLMQAEGLQWLSNNHTVTNTWLLLREIRKGQKMMKWSLSDGMQAVFAAFLLWVFLLPRLTHFSVWFGRGGGYPRGVGMSRGEYPRGEGVKYVQRGRGWIFQGWVSQNRGVSIARVSIGGGDIATKNEEICRLRQKYIFFAAKLTRLVTQTDDRF